MSTARTAALGCALLLGACSGSGEEQAADVNAAEASPPATAAAPARDFRYTSLADCVIERSIPEEAGFAEARCQGLGGYTLKRVDADARQNLIVVAPDGAETSLNLPSLMGGGFSGIADRIEWRGAAGNRFSPDALILRYEAVESPDPQVPPVSYLIPVRLAGGTVCATDRIAPGPNQNERARAAADTPGAACLESARPRQGGS